MPQLARGGFDQLHVPRQERPTKPRVRMPLTRHERMFACMLPAPHAGHAPCGWTAAYCPFRACREPQPRRLPRPSRSRRRLAGVDRGRSETDTPPPLALPEAADTRKLDMFDQIKMLRRAVRRRLGQPRRSVQAGTAAAWSGSSASSRSRTALSASAGRNVSIARFAAVTSSGALREAATAHCGLDEPSAPLRDYGRWASMRRSRSPGWSTRSCSAPVRVGVFAAIRRGFRGERPS
jgi:hypothetical protein